MARRGRLRLWLSDDDAHQVRQWLAPVLEQRRKAAEQQRRRRQLLTTLWLLVFAIALLTRYL
ncbi:MAG: hypothetical protein GAK31_03345 [Stenotrophomonas maltophilia]|uniref:Transmembrane protein n=1 Tax=Stenotrophomonas maltophilia TaxID=40324 RepID=A0A7V8FDG5_STEMA|nr:MAG: hypothetical protein GAK31_03345 [Stenotrophomonas maltophilia]